MNNLMPHICARSAWAGERRECVRLYRQFTGYFKGSFAAIRAYYGWKRQPMIRALRTGRQGL